jgi:hypothetical protein
VGEVPSATVAAHCPWRLDVGRPSGYDVAEPQLFKTPKAAPLKYARSRCDLVNAWKSMLRQGAAIPCGSGEQYDLYVQFETARRWDGRAASGDARVLAGGSCSGQGVGLPVAGQANVFRGKGCGMRRVMVENWVLWWPAKWPECKPDSADTFRSGRQYHTTTTTKTTQDSCRAPLPSAQMYMQSFLRESSEVGQVKA